MAQIKRPFHLPISRWMRFVALVAAIVLGAGGWGVYNIHVRHRLGTVRAGRVYQSGTMPPAEMAAVAKRLGLRTVIDLRTSREGQDSTNTTPMECIDAEGAALAGVGVRHILLPTPQVPSPETVAEFLKVMSDPANLPTLIHCYHGIGRTEVFTALYRIEFEGWSNRKARGEARFFLPGSSFSDTAEKGRFLIDYQPQLGLFKPVAVQKPTLKPAA